MNTKTKIKIYRKIIDEVSNKYERTSEFIRNKINELCSEHGISAEEVRLYVLMFVMLRIQFSYVRSLERIYFHYLFSIKIVLKCEA